MALPKRGVAWNTWTALVNATSRPSFKSSPTLAAGDWKVSIDGGTLNNLATLPSVVPSSSVMVKVPLSASEMDGDQITVVGIDQTNPKEWDDVVIVISTDPQIQIEATVNDASPAAGDFDGSTVLAATADLYNGGVLVFVSGALTGLARKISDYSSGRNLVFSGATGAADAPFPSAPANGDRFLILGRIG